VLLTHQKRTTLKPAIHGVCGQSGPVRANVRFSVRVGNPHVVKPFGCSPSKRRAVGLSVVAHSALGENGAIGEAAFWRLIDEGLVALVASDGHRRRRPPRLDQGSPCPRRSLRRTCGQRVIRRIVAAMDFPVASTAPVLRRANDPLSWSALRPVVGWA